MKAEARAIRKFCDSQVWEWLETTEGFNIYFDSEEDVIVFAKQVIYPDAGMGHHLVEVTRREAERAIEESSAMETALNLTSSNKVEIKFVTIELFVKSEDVGLIRMNSNVELKEEQHVLQ